MRMLVTIYFWAVFLTTSPVIFALGVLVWLLTLPFDPQRRLLHRFINTCTFQYLRAWPGWSARVEGRALLPQGPCVIIANHQSMADVIALMGLGTQYKFVSKASLFNLPLVGWMMRLLRHVSVERGRPHSTQTMVEDCRRWLRAGMSVLLFPEGTYSGGDRVLPFKRGAFLLAIEEKVPLVPVLVTGTRQLIHEDGPLMSLRASVRVKVLPAVPPSELGTDDAALAASWRQRYLELLGH